MRRAIERLDAEAEDNPNPVGRVYYSASMTLCVPASKVQEVGLAPRRDRPGCARSSPAAASPASGAAETPFNLVFEARP
jgi:hypothetical protein